ncbi:hypothetical protein [Asticcacaulis excentricus]|uniref:Uncharacterized protein n=1 Tax=Asticcacaulis excentricus (strain ATCC 15261 / DSM 4724 / KCTC 12464 / NCIMB 9791 / VKM B-1370 / CB 48) TaxID=573065 RepID=E8RMY6_ASTEC|nr:hypothetical protein [Asticcacaulis excentricus]ADU11749.1 hypothetical protein Astex_0045 [Asticcacaulis excentricus CB 48]
MHKWRRILIVLTVLVVVIGGLVCWDVYRAQVVAIDTLTYASSGKVSRVEPLIDGTSITNRLYSDIAPYEVVPVAAPKPAEQKGGLLQRMWDKGASLLGGKQKPAPEPEPEKTIDLHLCAQTAGEAQGFVTLLKYLKPQPAKLNWKPDPRIRYGSFAARQYRISGDDYLVVSRNGLDWKVTGLELSVARRKALARTCAGII